MPLGRILFLFFYRRRVREEGEIGHVHYIRFNSRDCPPNPIEYLKISGGIFQDSMVHQIDVLIWILGMKLNILADMESSLKHGEELALLYAMVVGCNLLKY